MIFDWLSETADSIYDLVLGGASLLSWFLTIPLISYPFGVAFTTFVALRAFYIQKRHERMADHYEKMIATLGDVIEMRPGFFSRSKSTSADEN